MTIDRVALMNAALEFRAAGITATPVCVDGSKAPLLPSWKEYQSEQPSIEQTVEWFSDERTDGIGLITGALSNLEMLEAEGRAIDEGVWDAFVMLCRDHGLGDTLDRIMEGYEEETPSGGIHLVYRLADGAPRPNTKLARRPSTPDELAANPKAKIQVLIETRGEGGFVVVAPSGGRTHPSGRPWQINSGGIATIATITSEERDGLFAVASLLDEMPVKEKPAMRRALNGLGSATPGLRPGDDWAAQTGWDDIIGKHGWTPVKRMGSGYGWRKPGSNDPGIHATTGQAKDGVDRLYVFSTATEFEPEVPYSKFAAYALLEHGEDYSAAARALAAAGYGTRAAVTVPDEPAFAAVGAAAVTSITPPDTVPDDFGPSLPIDAQHPQPPARRPLDTQDGHASLLIAEYHQVIRYCPELDRWLRWDRNLWKPQARDGGLVFEHAKEVARSLPGGTKEEDRFKRSCLTANGLASALRLAQTDRLVRVGVDDLDAHPWELNTPDGIIDLRTGRLTPPAPSHLHTKSTLVAPDWDADPSPWQEFLATTFGGDDELIAWIQRLMGYACIGEVREHILPVLHGQGANGKSVLLETVAGVLGDYAVTLPPRFLVQNGQGVTDATTLLGVRLAIGSETNEGEAFDEALVKRLTGGDTVRARYMRQDWFQFRPSHTLMLATNHRLEVPSGGGRSFWRRVREVPFDHIVPDDQQDPELAARMIRDHGPAIMAWLADGAAAYARDGLADPARVRQATADYEESADQVRQFLDERCYLNAHVREPITDVYAAYVAWCEESRVKPKEIKNKRAFGEAMKRHGIEVVRGSKGVRHYVGLRLEVDDASPALGDWGRNG